MCGKIVAAAQSGTAPCGLARGHVGRCIPVGARNLPRPGSRGASSTKRRNDGCVFCGKAPETTMWLQGAGRVVCCLTCREAKMKEGVK
jgi:hypothetical protein